MDKNTRFLREALKEAKKSNTLYGAVLVKDGKIVARAFNTVGEDNDPTAHAELNLISDYSRASGKKNLSKYILYSTCEPCPMCATAVIWSKISKVIFAWSIDDLIERGIPQISISSEQVVAKSQIEVSILQDNSINNLLESWHSELNK